jgi:hypothetical protein
MMQTCCLPALSGPGTADFVPLHLALAGETQAGSTGIRKLGRPSRLLENALTYLT